MKLDLSSRETHLNLLAEEPGYWCIYTDDPKMEKKFKGLGYEITKENTWGVEFKIPSECVTFVKNPVKKKKEVKKRNISEATRQQRSERMKAYHASKKEL